MFRCGRTQRSWRCSNSSIEPMTRFSGFVNLIPEVKVHFNCVTWNNHSSVSRLTWSELPSLMHPRTLVGQTFESSICRQPSVTDIMDGETSCLVHHAAITVTTETRLTLRRANPAPTKRVLWTLQTDIVDEIQDSLT